MANRTLVDTHVHVIAADHTRYPLKPFGGRLGEWVEEHPVTAEQMLAATQAEGVDHAVLVAAGSAYGTDNSYMADSAAAHPANFSSACIIDMQAPDAADTLEYWVKQRGMRGMRLFTTPDPEAPWLDSPATYPVWQRAEALGIPINAQVAARLIPRLHTMIERFPGVTVALDHLGNAIRGDSATVPQTLLDLAALPNAYLKWSCVNLDAAAQAGVEFRRLFEPLLERFGANRLLWGSNYPATNHSPYGDLVQAALDATAFVSEADRDLLFGGGALKLYSFASA